MSHAVFGGSEFYSLRSVAEPATRRTSGRSNLGTGYLDGTAHYTIPCAEPDGISGSPTRDNPVLRMVPGMAPRPPPVASPSTSADSSDGPQAFPSQGPSDRARSSSARPCHPLPLPLSTVLPFSTAEAEAAGVASAVPVEQYEVSSLTQAENNVANITNLSTAAASEHQPAGLHSVDQLKLARDASNQTLAMLSDELQSIAGGVQGSQADFLRRADGIAAALDERQRARESHLCDLRQFQYQCNDRLSKFVSER